MTNYTLLIGTILATIFFALDLIVGILKLVIEIYKDKESKNLLLYQKQIQINADLIKYLIYINENNSEIIKELNIDLEKLYELSKSMLKEIKND